MNTRYEKDDSFKYHCPDALHGVNDRSPLGQCIICFASIGPALTTCWYQLQDWLNNCQCGFHNHDLSDLLLSMMCDKYSTITSWLFCHYLSWDLARSQISAEVMTKEQLMAHMYSLDSTLYNKNQNELLLWNI